MRRLRFIGLVLLIAVVVRADEKVQVPEGVRYKKAAAEINDRAKELLRKRFHAKASDEDVLALFDKFVICGPALWRDLKTDESLAASKQGRVTFHVPVYDETGKVVRTDQMEGKLLQSDQEVLLLWKAFAKRTDFADLKIRKLNEQELKIFWAMISFDITEPLFMLDNGKHKVLVVFTAPQTLRIAWIDDYQKLVMKQEKPAKKSTTSRGG